MRPLACIVAEGLLDSDFDIKDNDLMPGVKNWARLLGRIQSIPKPKKVTGEKILKWVWQDVEVLKALSQSAKLDIGKTIGKNKAWDISIDRDQAIIAVHQSVSDPRADVIRFGNNDGYIEFRSKRYGFDGPVYAEAIQMSNLGISLGAMPASGWKFRTMPLEAYEQIKQKLGLV